MVFGKNVSQIICEFSRVLQKRKHVPSTSATWICGVGSSKYPLERKCTIEQIIRITGRGRCYTCLVGCHCSERKHLDDVDCFPFNMTFMSVSCTNSWKTTTPSSVRTYLAFHLSAFIFRCIICFSPGKAKVVVIFKSLLNSHRDFFSLSNEMFMFMCTNQTCTERLDGNPTIVHCVCMCVCMGDWSRITV